MMGEGETRRAIRRLLAALGQHSLDPTPLDDDDDLFRAGLKSLGVVRLMLAVEEEFEVEFPESMLRREVFASVTRICHAVADLQARPTSARVAKDADR